VIHLNYVGSHGVAFCQSTYRPNDLARSVLGRSGKPDADRLSECAGSEPLFYGGSRRPGPAGDTGKRCSACSFSSLYPQYTTEQCMKNTSLTVSQLGIGASIFNAAQAFITIQRSKEPLGYIELQPSPNSWANTSPLLTGFPQCE